MPPSHVLLVDEDRVSRASAWIERAAEGLVVRDVSENGIVVNDTRLSGGTIALHAGDEIRIGSTRLRVLEEPPRPSRRPPSTDLRRDDPSSADERSPAGNGTVRVDSVKLGQVALLLPWLQKREEAEVDAIDWLLDKELREHGLPDRATGAAPVASLLRRPPRSAHFGLPPEAWSDEWRGLPGAWKISALAADVVGLAGINDRLGMEGGDEVLRIVAAAMRGVDSLGRCFRIHGDAFALVLENPEDDPASHVHAIEAHLADAQKWSSIADLRDFALRLSFAGLRLTLLQPYSPSVLGPLVLAEIERALVLARRRGTIAICDRVLDLRGYLADDDQER